MALNVILRHEVNDPLSMTQSIREAVADRRSQSISGTWYATAEERAGADAVGPVSGFVTLLLLALRCCADARKSSASTVVVSYSVSCRFKEFGIRSGARVPVAWAHRQRAVQPAVLAIVAGLFAGLVALSVGLTRLALWPIAI